ncbi:MAG TPA: aldo/keto reductase [Thermoleophilaceae bacterium]|nr:aldo/keto reductase [Thermoleophilaceae bacterium]
MIVPLERHRVRRTGVELPSIGLGTGGLGGLYRSVADDEAHAVVRRALEAGVSYVDTAPQYGHGTAERRVGEALAGVERDAFTLSTKVGRLIVPRADGDTGVFADAPPSDAVFDFSRSGILRSFEASLRRLQLDRVDVVLIHDPDDYEDQALREAYPVLEELRGEGVVRAIGAGMNQTRVLERFVRETDVDLVLVAGRLTLLDREAASSLLPACLERDVAVVVGGVFNSGILADEGPDAHYGYAPASREVVERARALAATCARHGVSLRAAALQFPMRHPAVTSLLIGPRSVHELDDCLTELAREIPAELWAELGE